MQLRKAEQLRGTCVISLELQGHRDVYNTQSLSPSLYSPPFSRQLCLDAGRREFLGQ